MMHEREKSDPLVVPEKPTNKAERSVAEPPSRLRVFDTTGSGGAKRNASQQSTVRASCWKRASSPRRRDAVSQAQARIREAVARNPEGRLTTLLHHITADTLRSAFLDLKKRAAAGVDEVTWGDYAADLDRNLTDLAARVHRGAYRALPSRRVFIPKVRITTKPDSEYDRSRTVVRAIADSSPTKPDSATHRRAQRVTRQRPCQVCHA